MSAAEAQTPQQRPFTEVEQALLDDQRTLPPWVWYRLSGIEGEEEQRLRKLWPRISLARRRALLEDLEQLVETDYTLSYFAVGRVALEDPDARVRALAVRVLWDEEQVEFAERFLHLVEHDPDDEVRATAAGALGHFVYLGEVEELATALYHRILDTLLRICHDQTASAPLRRRALEAVSYATHPAVPDLIQAAYAQGSEDWRATALFAMGRHGDRRWVSTVLQHLHDPSPRLRAEAAQAAGALGLGRAINDLIDLLEDAEASVRMAAAWALSEIGKGGDKVRQALERALKGAADEEEASLYEEALDNFAFQSGVQEMMLLLLDEEETEDMLPPDLDVEELEEELLQAFLEAHHEMNGDSDEALPLADDEED